MRLHAPFGNKAGKAALALSAFIASVFTGLTLSTTPALAADKDNDIPLLAVTAGLFDALDQDDEAAEFRVEYRSAQKFWLLKPFGGLMATTDGGAHAYGGLLADIDLPGNFVLTPSFAPGLYHDGSGKDLGHVIEFRSQLELSYRFEDRSRLGVSISHLSNSNLDDRNPGAETIALTYALPFEGLFGGN